MDDELKNFFSGSNYSEGNFFFFFFFLQTDFKVDTAVAFRIISPEKKFFNSIIMLYVDRDNLTH